MLEVSVAANSNARAALVKLIKHHLVFRQRIAGILKPQLILKTYAPQSLRLGKTV